jgi:hypothetical protein
MKSIFAKPSPVPGEIIAVLPQFFRQSPVKIMAAPNVKCRRVLQTFSPLCPHDLVRRAEELEPQLIPYMNKPARVDPAFYESDDFHLRANDYQERSFI